MQRFFEVLLSTNLDRSADGPRMKVIGAGLPRCATSSLQAALESPTLDLGPCMHMANIIPNTMRSQIYVDAMLEEDTHKRRKLLHLIFDGYQATTDFPTNWFIDDLMDMYPDAAIVLNQRKGGGESWWYTFDGNLGLFEKWPYLLTCLPYKTDRLHWKIRHTAAVNWEKRWGVPEGPGFYDVYQEYVLKEAKKRGREVLVWKAEDGYEPLCKFLGKEVPKEKFPWVNDAKAITVAKRLLIARGVLTWGMILGSLYWTWRKWPNILSQGKEVLEVLRLALNLY